MSIFGYSQYASASQIGVSITSSELLSENEEGSHYNIELKFQNPSVLILTAGETQFYVISEDEIIGTGELEPFILQPLDSHFVKGTFQTFPNSDGKTNLVKISGETKYDVLFASINVPFVYYPTEEQAREFIHEN
ncbi:MAG: hypothetical protein HKM23_02365 [Nitrosopumilus sp.]|nr:hypothetical protein [Nitrosopumilus sp.]NND86177.1 hypothetical protein [Nitrosopumilus sp.]NNM03058.1 hypothetical protein [Nitrosopumilus sp.]